MCEQNNNSNNNDNESAQPQSAPQPIIINNVMSQPDDSGKKKAPGFIKVCVYSFLTCGIYFFYWLVKSINHGYRTK